MILNKIQNNKAFTLIELMVATTLFTVIMLMGIGSLITSSNSAKAAQKLRTAVDNVNFAMESMARELRTGTYFYCSSDVVYLSDPLSVKDCASGGTIIAFRPQQPSIPAKVAYKKHARGDGTFSIQRCETDVLPCPEVVSSDVDIQELKFYVKGAENLNDGIQPSAEILIKGVVKANGIDTPFYLQTMSSQRSTE